MTKKQQHQRKHHITAWQTNKPDHDSRCEARGQSQGRISESKKRSREEDGWGDFTLFWSWTKGFWRTFLHAFWCTHPTNLENTKPHCTDTKRPSDKFYHCFSLLWFKDLNLYYDSGAKIYCMLQQRADTKIRTRNLCTVYPSPIAWSLIV